MPKNTASEWLLARFIGDNRASAILGDLLEMATTRGRFWYCAAYVRTLISVGWRIPVALLCAYAFSGWVMARGFRSIHSLLLSWNRTGHYIPPKGIWLVATPNVLWLVVLGDSVIAFWFILPFVFVRYGLRDRVTHLTSAIVLLTIPYFAFYRAAVDIAGFIISALILTALCVRTWRRQMVVLAATVAPVGLAILLSPKLWYVFLSRGYGFASPQLQRAMAFYRALELCLAAIVCSSLYNRLLPKNQPPSAPSDSTTCSDVLNHR